MNTGPSWATAGPYFMTDLAPPGLSTFSPFLGGDVPDHVRATDPIAAAVQGYQAWALGEGQGASPDGQPAKTVSKPWYTRTAVIVLAVILIALGTYLAVKNA